jgi:hypothetical protein
VGDKEVGDKDKEGWEGGGGTAACEKEGSVIVRMQRREKGGEGRTGRE